MVRHGSLGNILLKTAELPLTWRLVESCISLTVLIVLKDFHILSQEKVCRFIYCSRQDRELIVLKQIELSRSFLLPRMLGCRWFPIWEIHRRRQTILQSQRLKSMGEIAAALFQQIFHLVSVKEPLLGPQSAMTLWNLTASATLEISLIRHQLGLQYCKVRFTIL